MAETPFDPPRPSEEECDDNAQFDRQTAFDLVETICKVLEVEPQIHTKERAAKAVQDSLRGWTPIFW